MYVTQISLGIVTLFVRGTILIYNLHTLLNIRIHQDNNRHGDKS